MLVTTSVKLKCVIVFLHVISHVSSDQSLSDLACLGTGSEVSVEGTSGIISSPNYPGEYPDYSECEWKITAPNGTLIGVKFDSEFHIEYQDDCVFDGVSFLKPNGTVYTTRCGDSAGNFISEGNELVVRFYSDGSETHTGFSFNWNTGFEKASLRNASEVSVEGTSGIISSPNYPDAYPNNEEIEWKITAPNGTFIRVEFESDFLMEGSDDCLFDGISFLKPNGTVYTTSCGYSVENVILEGNEFVVRFYSDYAVAYTGFSLNWTAIVGAPVCDGDQYQTGMFGVVSSPFYPYPYRKNLNCTWFINAPANTLILLRFEPIFEIVSGWFCTGSDSLQIFDGPNTDSEQFQITIFGEKAPPNFKSTSNAFTVRFVSGPYSDTAPAGFSFKWTAQVTPTPEMQSTQSTTTKGPVKNTEQSTKLVTDTTTSSSGHQLLPNYFAISTTLLTTVVAALFHSPYAV